jgi:hypothetical protein
MSTSKINQSKSSNSTSVKSSQDDGNDQANKPLAATLMQEFQNLKDKFKNIEEAKFIYEFREKNLELWEEISKKKIQCTKLGLKLN